MASSREALRALAKAWGVQTQYRDVFGSTQRASPETLVAVLGAMGAPIEGVGDAPEALRARHEQRWSRMLEPVTASWEGEDAAATLRVSEKAGGARADISVSLEDGSERSWDVALGELASLDRDDEGGRIALQLPLGDLPVGAHELRVRVSGVEGSALVLRAPARAATWSRERVWGVFVPLYALHSERSWGCGDLSDLAAMLDWVASLGGRLVGTLPLLAVFLDEPFEPSPYSPVSRLHWNEVFLDVEAIPELAGCEEARALLASPGVRSELDVLRGSRLVDYRALASVKRRIIEPMAALAASRSGAPLEDDIEDYAMFRGAMAARGSDWTAWDPDDERIDGAARDYHRFVQRCAREQLRALDDRGATMLFDLPVGVHPLGYDTWRYGEAFALDVHAGAPPDTFFTKGQDWAFSPLHPERIRETRYAYPLACFRSLMGHARVARVDHVMGLYRMWWIPPGAEAHEGAYVHYASDELFALLALESHRTGTIVLGEDLGTVPREVRRIMGTRRIHRSYVLQEELKPDPAEAMNPVPVASVASLNTHDMPSFPAFWDGLDIERRREMGLLDEAGAREEEERRATLRSALARTLRERGFLDEDAPPAHEAQRAALRALASSGGRVVVAALEDLWGETEPTNVPGTTGDQHPNWRRRGRYSLEEFRENPDVTGTLTEIDELRRKRRG